MNFGPLLHFRVDAACTVSMSARIPRTNVAKTDSLLAPACSSHPSNSSAADT